MKKNFYMDLLLFVSGLVCLITGIVLDFHLFGGFGGGRALKGLITDVPPSSGSIMMSGRLVQLVWHWKGIKAVAKKQIGHWTPTCIKKDASPMGLRLF